LVAHQWTPDGLTLRESGNPFRILWYLQEFREIIDAIEQGTNSHQAIVIGAGDVLGVLDHRQSGAFAASFALTGIKAT
jgi:hypothetical protein